MKQLFFTSLILSCFFVSTLSAQTGSFQIRGFLNEDYEGEPVRIEVLDANGFPHTYSDTVKDNAFLIEVSDCNSCDTKGKFLIGNDPDKEIMLWLDGSNIRVDIDQEQHGRLRITGTKLNDRYQQYRDTAEYYLEELAPFIAKNKGKVSFLIDPRSEEYKTQLSFGEFLFNFIKDNIRNQMGIYMFNKGYLRTHLAINYFKGDSAVIEVFNAADERIQSDPKAIGWKEYAEKNSYQKVQRKKMLNTKIMDINVLTVNGDAQKLLSIISESDSDYFLLDFWASWCGPCIAGMKGLKDIYTKYNQKSLEVIAISIDEKESLWKGKLNQINTPWINVLFDKDEISLDELKEKYNFSSIPFSVLVDKTGAIVSFLPVNSEIMGQLLDSILSAK